MVPIAVILTVVKGVEVGGRGGGGRGVGRGDAALSAGSSVIAVTRGPGTRLSEIDQDTRPQGFNTFHTLLSCNLVA